MALLAEKLVVAVSSRALFDLDESDAIFENEDVPHGVANE